MESVPVANGEVEQPTIQRTPLATPSTDYSVPCASEPVKSFRSVPLASLTGSLFDDRPLIGPNGKRIRPGKIATEAIFNTKSRRRKGVDNVSVDRRLLDMVATLQHSNTTLLEETAALKREMNTVRLENSVLKQALSALLENRSKSNAHKQAMQGQEMQGARIQGPEGGPTGPLYRPDRQAYKTQLQQGPQDPSQDPSQPYTAQLQQGPLQDPVQGPSLGPIVSPFQCCEGPFGSPAAAPFVPQFPDVQSTYLDPITRQPMASMRECSDYISSGRLGDMLPDMHDQLFDGRLPWDEHSSSLWEVRHDLQAHTDMLPDNRVAMQSLHLNDLSPHESHLPQHIPQRIPQQIPQHMEQQQEPPFPWLVLPNTVQQRRHEAREYANMAPISGGLPEERHRGMLVGMEKVGVVGMGQTDVQVAGMRVVRVQGPQWLQQMRYADMGPLGGPLVSGQQAHRQQYLQALPDGVSFQQPEERVPGYQGQPRVFVFQPMPCDPYQQPPTEAQKALLQSPDEVKTPAVHHQ